MSSTVTSSVSSTVLAAVQPRSNMLPAAASFVGRVAELEVLWERVCSEAGGLTSVVGPAGAGKTRLVRQLGECLVESLEEWTFRFVDLREVVSADALLDAVAASLHVRVPAQERAENVARVGHALERRAPQLVLVLDNFEQLAADSDAIEMIAQ